MDTLDGMTDAKPKESSIGSPRSLCILAFIALEPQLKRQEIHPSFFNSPAVEAVMSLNLNTENENSMRKEIDVASRISLFKNRGSHMPDAKDIFQELELLENKEFNSWFHGHSKSNKCEKRDEIPAFQRTEVDIMKLQLIEKENIYWKRKMACIGCKANRREVIALPCGHIALCRNCADSNHFCVVCGEQVLAEANVFLS